MPSLKDIIAAKNAAKAQATTSAPAQPSRETLAEQAELKAAIDRIDPPGKRERAEAARKAVGLILNKDLPSPPNGEARGQATPIKGPDLPRSLGAHAGETIDMTPMGASEEERKWHEAVNSLTTSLCIVTDPADRETAWIAVRHQEYPDFPILIMPLRIYDHPRAHRQPNVPF